MEFNPNVIRRFTFKWQADRYAAKARQAGYSAEVRSSGSNWLLLGGKWGVTLSTSNPRRWPEVL